MILVKLFDGEINVNEFVLGTSIEKLISENKFNTKFMRIDFFKDNEYRKNWREKDFGIKWLGNKEARLPGETFEECIFRQGLLYNQKTQKYDIPALQKYNPKE